jgi:hypothetical protein
MNLSLEAATSDKFSWFVYPPRQILGVCFTSAVITGIKLENQRQVTMHKLNGHFNLNYGMEYSILLHKTLKAILLQSCPCTSHDNNTWKQKYSPFILDISTLTTAS